MKSGEKEEIGISETSHRFTEAQRKCKQRLWVSGKGKVGTLLKKSPAVQTRIKNLRSHLTEMEDRLRNGHNGPDADPENSGKSDWAAVPGIFQN